MLISYEKKFIFIHIYKIAGSSVRQALCRYEPLSVKFKRLIGFVLAKCKVIRPNQVYTAGLFNYKNTPTHATAQQIKEKLQVHVYDNFFKFAFVRNPWDWQVSLYHYALNSQYHHSDLTKKMKNFDEYIEWRVSNDVHLQKEFVTDGAGNIIVDFIGKVEKIDKNFVEICNRVGIESHLSHINKTKHRDYKQYYNSRTRELVYNAFHEDIELFEYSF